MTNAELADEIERVAKATVSGYQGDIFVTKEERLGRYLAGSRIREIIAALRQPSSDKVLVPREPTTEMTSAGAACMPIEPVPFGEPIVNHMLRRAAIVYRAMLLVAELGQEPHQKPDDRSSKS